MNNKSFKELIMQLSELSTSQRRKIMRFINPDKKQKPITTLINAQAQYGVICAYCNGTHQKMGI